MQPDLCKHLKSPAPLLPADDITFIGHMTLQPIAGLGSLFLYEQHVTTEAISCRVT